MLTRFRIRIPFGLMRRQCRPRTDRHGLPTIRSSQRAMPLSRLVGRANLTGNGGGAEARCSSEGMDGGDRHNRSKIRPNGAAMVTNSIEPLPMVANTRGSCEWFGLVRFSIGCGQLRVMQLIATVANGCRYSPFYSPSLSSSCAPHKTTQISMESSAWISI